MENSGQTCPPTTLQHVGTAWAHDRPKTKGKDWITQTERQDYDPDDDDDDVGDADLHDVDDVDGAGDVGDDAMMLQQLIKIIMRISEGDWAEHLACASQPWSSITVAAVRPPPLPAELPRLKAPTADALTTMTATTSA